MMLQTDLVERHSNFSDDLRHEKQAHEPSPRQQLERQVMPQGDKGEDQHGRRDDIFGPADGNVQVSDRDQ